MIRRRRRHNDREAGVTDKQHCDGLGPIIPESDENFPPNRRLIIQAGKLARAEQARLEREYRLRDGRRPKTEDPGGIFSADEGTHRASGAISPHIRPPWFPIFWEFFIQAPQRRLAHELEERRALVGLVRVRPAEEDLLGPQGRGRPWFRSRRGLSRISARRRP
jgi:hypothetical protein